MILETLEHSDNETKVIAQSIFSGNISEMVIPLSLREFTASINKSKTELLQRAFPTLNSTQREFIKTGATQAEWDKMFPDE
jgi:hypothetical protein